MGKDALKLILVLCVIGFASASITWFRWRNDTPRNATRQAQQLPKKDLQGKDQQVYQQIQKNYPGLKVLSVVDLPDATYTANDTPEARKPGGTVPFNTTLSKCYLEEVEVAPEPNGFSITMTIRGIGAIPTNPQLSVSLFDVNGKLLGRGNIVGFIKASLHPGEVTTVKDFVGTSLGTPHFVGIDEFDLTLSKNRQREAAMRPSYRGTNYNTKPGSSEQTPSQLWEGVFNIV